MKIEKVTVRLGKTIPGPEYGGGQFANVKPEVEMVAILEPGESVKDATVALLQQCKPALEYAANELIGRSVQPKPAYAPAPQPVSIATPQQPPLSRPPAPIPPPVPFAGIPTNSVGLNAGQTVPTIPKVDPLSW